MALSEAVRWGRDAFWIYLQLLNTPFSPAWNVSFSKCQVLRSVRKKVTPWPSSVSTRMRPHAAPDIR